MFRSDSPAADGGGEKSPTGDKDGRKSSHLLLTRNTLQVQPEEAGVFGVWFFPKAV